MAKVCTLPTELMVQILGSLPAREIQLSRQLCCRFKDVVDNNADALANPIQSRENDRLTEYIQHTFEYDITEVSPPSALRRWFLHRPVVFLGAPTSREELGGEMHASSPYVGQILKRKPLVVTGMTQAEYGKAVSRHMYSLMTLMIHSHHLAHIFGETDRERVLENIQRNAGRIGESMVSKAIGWNASKIKRWFRTIADSDRRMLPSKAYTPQEVVQKILKLFPITEFDHLAMGSAAGRSYDETNETHKSKLNSHCKPLCTPGELAAAVGVPVLPSFEPVVSSKGYAAYCVRAKWAYELVKLALAGNMSPLQRAAAMEELFIS